MRVVSTSILCFLLLLSAVREGKSFSLLGPFKNTTNNAPDPWQGKPYAGRPWGLGHHLPGDIGGPMFLNEGYRWNLPVIYYGFDKSFVDYFGQPGIDAVDSAIAILNALPPASEMRADLLEFPLDSRSENASAASLNLLDMKSFILPLLLEQLGLANPERNAWSLRNRMVNEAEGVTNYVVLNLNYDPVSSSETWFVNGVVYNHQVYDDIGFPGSEWASAVEWFQLDPSLQPYSSVAGGLGSGDLHRDYPPGLMPGQFFTAFTRDDAGGLRFLLSRDNKAVEALPSGVAGHGNDATNFVNVALRGGVEKLHFVKLPLDAAGQFVTETNFFSDVYYVDGNAVTQSVSRVVRTPDIVFRARDLGGKVFRSTNQGNLHTYFYPRLLERSDTSHWINNSGINPQASPGGPGVIPPGAVITLNKLGRYNAGSYPQWATFDGSGDPPEIILGSETNHTSLVLETRLLHTNNVPYLEWTTMFHPGAYYRMEVSTNLVHWSALADVNTIGLEEPLFIWSVPATNDHRFYRTVKSEQPF